MRLHIFLHIVAAGLICSAVLCVAALLSSDSLIRSSRTAEVREYTAELIDRMTANVYVASPSQNPDINSELDILAKMYDGRIIVTNSRLDVIFDSVHTDVERTLGEPEALLALRGIESEKKDSSKHSSTLYLPISDETVQGIMVVSFSTANVSNFGRSLFNALMIAVFLLVLFTIIIGMFTARNLTRPLVKINQSLNDTCDGNTDEEMHITGFSEMDQISDSYNKMLGRMAAIEESRQEFVSNVSHELKTPLTSMKVLSDSLIQQPDAPVELYREFMTDINAEIDRENKIINDLLSLVKLDRKTGDMHIALVSINEMIDIVIKRIKPIAQDAGIEIIYESYREILAEVDEVKLSLAVTNLIENAIKYNKENGVVHISLNADHRYFMITVADTGIGIPQASQDMIFERFYRVDKTRSRQSGGTGLGLSITKSIVIMHHGAIKLESSEGVGSTFVIKIPLSYIPEV